MSRFPIRLFVPPELMESMRAADSSNWSLNPDQVLDLAASLSDFFVRRNQIKSELSPDYSQNFAQDADLERYLGGSNQGMSCNHPKMSTTFLILIPSLFVSNLQDCSAYSHG